MGRLRKTITAGLSGVGAFVLALAVAAAPAPAVVVHPYVSQITEAGGARLELPWGLAFDSSGDLLVGENTNHEVDVFNSANTFTGHVQVAGNDVRDVSVAAATGDLYVSHSSDSFVSVLEPEGGGYRLIQAPSFIANGNYVHAFVDNAGGPHDGDVYLIENGGTLLVFKTNAAGELAERGEALKPPEEGFALRGGHIGPNGEANTDSGLAFNDATGVMYLANPGAQPGYVDEYNSEDDYLGHFSGPTGAAGRFEPIAVAVEGSTGDVYVVDAANERVDEFNASGDFIGTIAEASVGDSLSSALGVAVNASGDVYVSSGAAVDVFGPGFSAPGVTTGAASAITRTTATLEGAVDPEGSTVVSCAFEYGTTLAFGHTAPCAPAPGSGLNPVTVTAEVSGLAPEAVYHYRLVAGYAKGVNVGAPRTVETAELVPELRTEAASGIELSGGQLLATLDGSFAPDGLDTHYYFEYGETEALGSKTPEKDAGSESKLGHFAEQITGLKPEATYFFEIVASNSLGANRGALERFKAPPAVQGVSTEAATNVGLVGTKVGVTLHGSLAPDGLDTHYYFEYGETDKYGSTTAEADAGSASEVKHEQSQATGLKPYAIYHYRLVAVNALGTTHGADMSFNTVGVVPPLIVEIGPASEISQFSATLNGTLETDEEVANYHFEYGTTTAYGQIAPIPDNFTPITAQPIAISQPIYGLQAGTTYHYRLVASSPGGTELKSQDETFTTLPIPPPAASTGVVEGVGVGEATLTGAIDPHGWETTYLFEYGTSTAYGSEWPTVAVSMGALEGSQPVVVTVPGLQPGTTYHFRLVATSGGGTTYGADMAFTTGSYPVEPIREPVVFRTLLVPSEPGIVVGSTRKAKKPKKRRKSNRHHSAKRSGAQKAKKHTARRGRRRR
jgi:hypothetical protein